MKDKTPSIPQKEFSIYVQKRLLERGWDGPMTLDARTPFEGWTPLMNAVRQGISKMTGNPSYTSYKPDLELTRWLLEEGCDIYAQNDAGRTVWTFCAEFEEIPFLLLNHWKDVTRLNEHGECFLQELLDDDDMFFYLDSKNADSFVQTMLPFLFEANMDVRQPNTDGISLIDVLKKINFDESKVEACFAQFQQKKWLEKLPEAQSIPSPKIRI